MNPTVVEAIQASNALKLSRGVTGIKEDNHGLKSTLAASNDKCWQLTSGPFIIKNGNKWRCQVTKRLKPNSLRGKNIHGLYYATRTEVELNLFKFRFGLESKSRKESVSTRIKEMVENRPSIKINAGIDDSVFDIIDSLASPSSSNDNSDSVLENVATTTLNHVTMVHSTPSIESLPQKIKKNKRKNKKR